MFEIFFKLFIIGVIIFNLCSCASSNTPATQKVNYVYKYESNSPIKIDHTASLNDNVYTIYLSVNIRRLRSEGAVEVFKKNIKLSYTQKQEYNGPDLINVDSIEGLNIEKKGEAFVCSFNLPRTSSFPRFLIIKARDVRTDFEVVEEIILETEGKSNFWTSILYSLSDSTPVFSSFGQTEVQYLIKRPGASRDYFVSYTKNEFPPAPAPMSTSGKAVSKELKIDSIYNIKANEPISFDSAGLYLVQEDTTSNDGLGFRIETGKYPKYTKISSLIKPLIYISTVEEIRALNKSENTKKALDDYWLKLAGNANDAKRVIKLFYDRVEAANEKFTSYKEGWKTDMGMIYIVFGIPDEVLSIGEQEQWIYHKSTGMSEVKFTFTKIKNIYSNNHYELIRYAEYEEYWYNKVDLWRKGTPGI